MIAKVKAIDGVVPSPYDREVTTGRSSPKTTRQTRATRATGLAAPVVPTTSATERVAATAANVPTSSTAHSRYAKLPGVNGVGGAEELGASSSLIPPPFPWSGHPLGDCLWSGRSSA
jgi:hypothetical protein